jgi:hypothetical protein
MCKEEHIFSLQFILLQNMRMSKLFTAIVKTNKKIKSGKKPKVHPIICHEDTEGE